MNNANLTGQLPFEFTPEPYLGKEDFMVAACNYEASNWLMPGRTGPFSPFAFMVPKAAAKRTWPLCLPTMSPI